MLSSENILQYFFVFFITTLIGFVLIYKHAIFNINSNRPNICIEKILARCAPKSNSEKLLREDLTRSRGGLSFGAEEYFSEEKREKIISRYTQKGSKEYAKIKSIFNDAFNRQDEEMLICLGKYITTYNNEPSCNSIKKKEISTEKMIIYFTIAIIFGVLITLFCHVISTFFL
jgi:hypothetical protein